MLKRNVENLARERISILISCALREKHIDYNLSNDQAQLAKKIAKRVRLKLPYSIKQHYCKKCKKFISPDYNARVRLGRSSIKAIRITCLNCNHTYRKLIRKDH